MSRWLLFIGLSLSVFLAGCNVNRLDHNQSILSQAATPLTLCSTASSPSGSGAYTNTTGNPVGGGVGYTLIVNRNTANYIVATDTQLMTALQNATSGQVIFVENYANIDLTDERNAGPIAIKAGVTLASDRGKSGSLGARIYAADLSDTDPYDNPYLFTVANGARVTGLRIEGPYKTKDDVGPSEISLEALTSATTFTLDNNELFGWSAAAVRVLGGNGWIHHNYIHNNQRFGRGYGILLKFDGKACIEANLFDRNRHAIAADGEYTNIPTNYQQGYEARFNLTVHSSDERSTSNSNLSIRHDFDIHGECETPNVTSGYAGHTVKIHHNTFLDTHVNDPATGSILIRGKPASGAYINNNIFTDTSTNALKQPLPPTNKPACNNANYNAIDSNYVTTPNTFSTSSSVFYTSRSSGTAFEDWKPIAAHNYALSDFAFRDFNQDGATDIFRADGTNWYISYGGNGNWTNVATSAYQLSSLAFGDFVGDSKLDVFRVSGNTWYIAQNNGTGFGSWTTLATVDATYTLNNLGFGDFTGNSKMDVLKTTGSAWQVASTESTWAWTAFRTSVYTIAGGKLGFGDFNGGGKTDVFLSEAYTTTTTWQYLPSETVQNWVTLKTFTTSYPLNALALADFDGNGKTDVFQSVVSGTGASMATTWSVSLDGTGNWTTFKTFTGSTANYPLNQLRFGSFDGDIKADVFQVGGL